MLIGFGFGGLLIAVDEMVKGFSLRAFSAATFGLGLGSVIALLIDKSGQPKVYLYDEAMKPLERSDMRAKLTVKSHDGAQHERDLNFSKDPKEGPLLRGEPIKGLTDWDTAVVSLKLKDSWTHLRFSHHDQRKRDRAAVRAVHPRRRQA